MKQTLPIAALLSLLASCAHAAPTCITTAQGRGADTPIRGGNWKNDNFGTMDLMRVRNSADLGGTRKTYLRFDLGLLVKPAKDAAAVTLGLDVVPAEGHSAAGKVWTFNVSGMKDGSPDENWDEKGVRWTNAPANVATSPLDLTPEVQPLGTFTITGTGIPGQKIAFSSREFTRFVKSDTNGVITLVITRQNQGDGADNDVVHIFASKEYSPAAPPVLAVDFKEKTAALPSDKQWEQLPVAPKALPYENDIEAFEAADKLNPPVKGGIVFVGSSSIRLWKTLATDFPDRNTINRGFGGSEIHDSANFAQRIVTPYEPKMIVFYAGTNDLGNGKSAESIYEGYTAFVAKVREKMPTVPIAYISISPSPARWDRLEDLKKANALIKAYADSHPNLKFIDIAPLMLGANGQKRPELFVEDGLHMNPTGYAIWVKAVEPYLPAK